MARPKPVPVRCTGTQLAGPRLIRAGFTGYSFEGTPLPASYLELWFAEPPDPWPPRHRTGGRSPKRTFTPIEVDPIAGTFVVEFVLHGRGTATDWASSATIGSQIWAGPVRGGYSVDPDSSRLLLVGDDTAIPAIGTIIDRAGGDIPITTIVEVVDADDERPVGNRDTDPIWLHRGSNPGMTGHLTTNLLATMEIPEDSDWWVGGEREAIRRIRDLAVDRFGTDRSRIDLNAHWRLDPVDPRVRN